VNTRESAASIRALTIIWFAVIATVLAPPTHALTLVRTSELPDLVDESHRAVLATVTSVLHGFDEQGLHSTFVKLRVEDHLYGPDVPPPGQEMDIKIYGAPETMPDGSRLFVEGTPRYTIGDRYLLLMIEDSPWGFTNTAGLHQGAFRITGSDGGLFAESLAGNGNVLGEEGLRRWLDVDQVSSDETQFLSHTEGPVPFSMLRKAVVDLWVGLGRPLPTLEPSYEGGEEVRP
jgi:hypothetical protein